MVPLLATLRQFLNPQQESTHQLSISTVAKWARLLARITLSEVGLRYRPLSQPWQNPGVAVPFRAQLPPGLSQS
jgi:hypothetical protein